MEYYYKKQSNLSFEDTIIKAKEVLKKHEFSIMMELDIKAKMEEKLFVEREPYTILGACHAPFAHRSLRAEKEIGVMLPCNVAVFEKEGKVYVAMVRPQALMSVSDNPDLQTIAQQAEKRAEKIIQEI